VKHHNKSPQQAPSEMQHQTNVLTVFLDVILARIRVFASLARQAGHQTNIGMIVTVKAA